MGEFVQSQGLGWAFPQEPAFERFPAAASGVRKPDTSSARRGRFPGERSADGYIEVEWKVRQALAAGLRLVWVVIPGARAARVYRRGQPSGGVEPNGFLDGEDVLPGFRLRLADLCPPDPPPGTPAAGGQAINLSGDVGSG